MFLAFLVVAALLAPFSAFAAASKAKPKPNLAPALNALSTSRASFLAGNFYSPPKSRKSLPGDVSAPVVPAPPPPDTPSLFSALGTATSKTYRPSSGAEFVLAPQVSGGWREEHFNRRPIDDSRFSGVLRGETDTFTSAYLQPEKENSVAGISLDGLFQTDNGQSWKIKASYGVELHEGMRDKVGDHSLFGGVEWRF